MRKLINRLEWIANIVQWFLFIGCFCIGYVSNSKTEALIFMSAGMFFLFIIFICVYLVSALSKIYTDLNIEIEEIFERFKTIEGLTGKSELSRMQIAISKALAK